MVLKVGVEVGMELGAFVSCAAIGKDVVGYFDGNPLGSLVGTLLVGLEVGWVVGCSEG